MDELTSQSASRLAELIRTRVISPVEVVAAHLQRIERVNPQLNAIVTLAPDARTRAREAEARVMNGDKLGVLHGVPLTIKDTIETAGLRTTGGSLINEDFVPAKDATAVARLKAAGAIILGKTNTPELAIPYETDNPIVGRTNNPYDLSRTAGGSSGGEAAATAACLAPAGIGSDLSGSIRVPAHFCGIAGLKPTSDRVPMDGHIPPPTGPFARAACIGPMARNVEDLGLLFKVIATNVGGSRAASRSVRGLRIGWYASDGVVPVTVETSKAVETVVAALGHAGAEISECIPPGISEGSRLWIELYSQASLAQLRDIYRGQEDQAGPVVRALFNSASSRGQPEIGAREVLNERDQLRRELLQWMESTPIIIAPVGSITAFAHGAGRVQVEGETISIFRAFSYSQTYNVFDLPVVTVPVTQTVEGLPLGVQIIGRPYEEDLVLMVAAMVESEFGGWRPVSGEL
ncbi:MAG: amidase [Blastocatellia bacterium]|nr:amidase [Blastocatellia bacterium]